MSNQDLAIRFIEAFCSGDVDGIGEALHKDFSLRGPLGKYDSRMAYLEGLRRDPPVPGSCRIIEAFEASDRIAVFYEYERAGTVMKIAQAFWFEKAKITRSMLIFDPAPARGNQLAP